MENVMKNDLLPFIFLFFYFLLNYTHRTCNDLPYKLV